MEKERDEINQLERLIERVKEDPFLARAFDSDSQQAKRRGAGAERLKGVLVVKRRGWRFYIGRNVEANEVLFEVMPRWSYWFHVKDYPGPHVYGVPPDKRVEPTEEDQLFGASLAIEYIRKSGKFEVLCVPKKNLRKAKGKRGVLIYSGERVILVEK